MMRHMATGAPNTVRFTKYLTSSEGVYGLILVSGLIAAAAGSGASSFRMLLFVAVTLGVFWLAHVYAAVVGSHGSEGHDGQPMPLRAVIRESMDESKDMLLAAVLPAAALVLGVLGILHDRTAGWVAMWVCVAVLALLGYRSYRRLGARLLVRLLGALATASFGLVIIIAKAIVTH